MALINTTLLAGIVLAAVPILLHLMMRAKPKRIEFPALQLLRSRQTSNSRRMRLRHLLLLLLRAMVILVAVLALARPSLPAAQYGLQLHEWLTLAAVVFGCIGLYRWLSKRSAATVTAEHLLRERRGRLRAMVLLGGLLATLLCVGLPWGFRVQAEVTGPRNPLAEDTPVAAVFLFDNSLSMTYKHESLTRLEMAGHIAEKHLSVLPQRSRVAVVTTNPDSEVVFQADLAGTQSRIEDLEPTAIARSLNVVIRTAIDAQLTDREQVMAEGGASDTYAREIYVFTDLSQAAWKTPDESGLHDLLVQHEWLQVYLVDVSLSNPQNVSLGQLHLDRDTTAEGQNVNVSVTVNTTADGPTEATLEVFTIDQSGTEIAGGGGAARRLIRFTGTPPVATFPVTGATGIKFQRGYIRLATPDPLPADDIRYFSFGVAPIPRVLLVADRKEDSKYLLNVLQPEFMERLGVRRFECKSITIAELGAEQLKKYDVVCVVNTFRPEPGFWTDLLRFVRDGGAMLVTTGGEKSIQPDSWRTPDAMELLPGWPVIKVPFRNQPGQLNVVATDHPITSPFTTDPDAMTELSRALFDQCWTFDLASDARVLLSFNDHTRRPAMLERQVGQGHVLLFASAVDNLQNGGAKWNENFVIDNWAFLMLMDQSMQYVLHATADKRNFTVGDPVEIRIPAAQRFRQYVVARPRFRLTEGSLAVDEATLLLTDIDTPGHYQVRASDETSSFRAEFAANIPDAESDLTVITEESLNEILGSERYSRVTDPEQLERAVNVGRLGVEVFPVLLGLLILLFCSEHLMANFFYDPEPEAPARKTPAMARS